MPLQHQLPALRQTEFHATGETRWGEEGGREEEGERKAMCGFEWFVGPLHLAQRVITESWVNHACNHGYVVQ